ncbi:MAG: hypothetical protein JWN98_1476, partial [Abditibacteriota bacterium]|nr:hypothetical protein [Abditibacteriota bacterium]
AVAWGNNYYGQLGDDSTDDRNVPVAVRNLSNVRSLAAGTGHTLALLNEGTLRAWGWNEYGQLGDGSRDDRRLPVVVRNLGGLRSIAAGYAHNLVLRPPLVAPVARQSFVAPSQVKVGTDNIRIFFAMPLDVKSACYIESYTVLVDGRRVELESVAYNTSTGCVTLGLPESTLIAGDMFEVSWNDLKDRAGVAITGQFGPAIAGRGD